MILVPYLYMESTRRMDRMNFRRPEFRQTRENENQDVGCAAEAAGTDGGRECGEGESAKRENNCFEAPLTTTSCARVWCAAAKEWYYPEFSSAYRPHAAFELRFSHKLPGVLYSTSVHNDARRRGYWRKTEVEPRFSRPLPPLRKSRFEWAGFGFSAARPSGRQGGNAKSLRSRKMLAFRARFAVGIRCDRDSQNQEQGVSCVS